MKSEQIHTQLFFYYIALYPTAKRQTDNEENGNDFMCYDSEISFELTSIEK